MISLRLQIASSTYEWNQHHGSNFGVNIITLKLNNDVSPANVHMLRAKSGYYCDAVFAQLTSTGAESSGASAVADV